jgi:hypothetical protein
MKTGTLNQIYDMEMSVKNSILVLKFMNVRTLCSLDKPALEPVWTQWRRENYQTSPRIEPPNPTPAYF